MHCAACGYPRDTHDLGTNRCHPATANSKGARGVWRDPPPLDPMLYPDVLRRDAEARRLEFERKHAVYVPEVILPPQVPARAPRDGSEIAGYQGKQGVGLGRRATALGWAAAARYWRSGEGVEGCAVQLARGTLRAVATWSRKAGNVGAKAGWAVDVAYAWRTDVERIPTKLTHTQLEGLIT